MGARLVSAALHPHWTSVLTDKERLVWIAMCHQARDLENAVAPADIYMAGREWLILTAWGDIPDRGTPAYRTKSKRVQQIITKLIDLGAVERVQAGNRTTPSAYRLHPNAWQTHA